MFGSLISIPSNPGDTLACAPPIFCQHIFNLMEDGFLVIFYSDDIMGFPFHDLLGDCSVTSPPIVTMQSLTPNAFINNETALISLLFSLTWNWLKKTPLAPDYAETIQNLKPSWPVARSLSHLLGPLIRLPSMAIPPLIFQQISFTYPRNIDSK